MTKQSRSHVAVAMIAGALTSFFIRLWLFFSYFNTHPRESHPELSLVYPLNNHGSYVFVSGAEVTGLALLTYVFFATLVLAFVLVPKDTAGSPIWIAKINNGAERWSTGYFMVFVIAVLLSAAIILLGGPVIVNYLIAHGVVLRD